ncbi:MAG: hypothetical protein ACK478_10355 [Flavobacteriales bacterium]|jgi:hypothetical protein
MKNALIIGLMGMLLWGCKKEPGVGGDAEIKGQVWTYQLNGSLTDTIADYAAEDVYVYIVYGDNTGFDKRVKTDYNGNFRFPFLYEGKYTLYTYSFDPYAIDGQSPVIQEITISDRKEIVEMERMNTLAQP